LFFQIKKILGGNFSVADWLLLITSGWQASNHILWLQGNQLPIAFK
jgi:hypothetical protein